MSKHTNVFTSNIHESLPLPQENSSLEARGARGLTQPFRGAVQA